MQFSAKHKVFLRLFYCASCICLAFYWIGPTSSPRRQINTRVHWIYPRFPLKSSTFSSSTNTSTRQESFSPHIIQYPINIQKNNFHTHLSLCSSTMPLSLSSPLSKIPKPDTPYRIWLPDKYLLLCHNNCIYNVSSVFRRSLLSFYNWIQRCRFHHAYCFMWSRETIPAICLPVWFRDLMSATLLASSLIRLTKLPIITG